MDPNNLDIKPPVALIKHLRWIIKNRPDPEETATIFLSVAIIEFLKDDVSPTVIKDFVARVIDSAIDTMIKNYESQKSN